MAFGRKSFTAVKDRKIIVIRLNDLSVFNGILPCQLPHIKNIHNINLTIIYHIEIQVAVAVHISQRHRHAAASRTQPAVFLVFKPSLAVIQVESIFTVDGCDQQIKMPVSVYIGKHSSGRKMICVGNSGLLCDILKAKSAKVFVEFVGAVNPGKIEIRQPVPCDIAGGNA